MVYTAYLMRRVKVGSALNLSTWPKVLSSSENRPIVHGVLISASDVSGLFHTAADLHQRKGAL
jgi:hypothetical protein